MCDEEVTEGHDLPGFTLCDRKRCMARLEGLEAEERRAIYEATVAQRGGASPNGRPRRPKGELTDLNIFVLNEYMHGREAVNAPSGVITRVPTTDHPHLKRLVEAGWLVPTPAVRGGVVLSPLGRDGLAAWRERKGIVAHPNGYSSEELEAALERLDDMMGELDFSLVQEGDDLSFRKPKAMGYHYTSKRNLEAIERDGLGGRVSFEPHEFAFWLALPYIATEDAASVLIDYERDRERPYSRGEPSQKTLDKLQSFLDDVSDLHVVWFYREPGFAGSTAGRRETCVKFNLNEVGDWLSSHAESVHEFTDHADGYAVAWIGPKIPPRFLQDCGEDF